jgi:predicted choloylglycine hydrolase
MEKEIKNLLEDLDCGEEVHTKYGICYAYTPDIIEELQHALTTKSKKEQAFDIAAEKMVDMYRLSVADNVASYNKWTEFDEYWLTKEEYNLIKEVLKNE